MARRFPFPRSTPVIDLSEENDEEVRREVGMVIDLTGDNDEPQVQQRPFSRISPIEIPSQGVSFVHHNGFCIRLGSYVEVTTLPASCQAQFLKVTSIMDLPGGVFVHGLPFARNRRVNNQLPKKLNEVCLILDSARDDPRTEEQQGIVAVPLHHVIKPRDLECTNADYPTHKYQLSNYDILHAEENGRLICRWKRQRIWASSQTRRAGKPPQEFAIIHLGPEDVAKEEYRVSEMDRSNDWNAGKTGAAPNPVDVQIQNHAWNIQPSGRRQNYSYGDAFCGAGGASSGARGAGLDVLMACDNNEVAISTYKSNFPNAQVFNEDVYDFITKNLYRGPRLDVIHLSPPCQPYSPAHTTPGQNDEANQAALFACQEIAKRKCRRIFTLEETYGIMSCAKHADFFDGLVHSFTNLGCSVRWKIVDLRNWGVPMKRLRLIMIGSCPGEPLPDFPANTHSEHGGAHLQPWATVARALSRIPNAAVHNDRSHIVIPSMRFPFPWPAWNANIALPRTIVTAGTPGDKPGDYHPSGTRKFTCRELATIASFPVDYNFEGTVTEQRRQIGNVFPPAAAQTLLTHLRQFMERTDQARRAVNPLPQLPNPNPPEAMVIDDSNDGNNVIAVDDDDGDEDVVILDSMPSRPSSATSSRTLGRPELEINSPGGNQQIIVLDGDRTMIIID
ncbi:DNA (cytosine-5)-methyltransferase PliMCI [Apiospora rasikravindrae]|uniref:DNA (cytosine-5-)-methyltransferase n=1 Tax=Apiospora rasikravindrae TaxID=990691 RepID=A0ABR1TFT6_9PEZI